MDNTTSKAGGISVHAFDISRGIPANGLGVRITLLGLKRTEIADGRCASNGVLQHPIAQGNGVMAGLYEIEFDVGRFFRETDVVMPDPAFLEVATFRFGIDKVAEHFHLPFKFTPWGFSLFRGGE